MTNVYAPCSYGIAKMFKSCCFQKGKALNREDPKILMRRAAELKVHECFVSPLPSFICPRLSARLM